MLALFVHPRLVPKVLWWRSIQRQLARLDELLSCDESLVLALTPDDVVESARRGVRCVVVALEGLHAVEGDAEERMELLWQRGVRIFTLTWNNSNAFASAALDVHADGGLSPEGRKMVGWIRERGGIVDLSHASDKTFWDVLELGVTPILSHSALRELCGTSRNATTAMVRALGEAGGVIGINLFPGFLAKKRYSAVTSDDVVAHISAAIDAGGEGVAAIGSDFDGVKALPKDIPDAAAFAKIPQKLLEYGFGEDVVKGVVGANFIRCWRKVLEKVKGNAQKA